MLLSLDLSTKNSGWALFDKNEKLIKYGEISASSTDVIKRIYKIRDEIRKIISENKIDKIILEEVLPSNEPSNEYSRIPNVWKALTKLQAAIEFMLHDEFNYIKQDFILPNSWRTKIGIHTGRGITRDILKKKDIEFVKNSFGIECGDDAADAILIGYSSFVKEKKSIIIDGFEFK